MKLRTVVLIILIIIIADQSLKIWVKTSFLYEEQRTIFKNWFRLYFIENDGMAYGWKLKGGNIGKIALTVFRLAAVIFGSWYIVRIIKKGYHKGFVICVALIYAGALGNLIDSMFYGIIFDKGMIYDAINNRHLGYQDLAKISTNGYSNFLHGNVVDMLYFPIFESDKLPSWVPFWGGEPATFFSYIFNIADASISIGVITLFIFQKKFIKQQSQEDKASIQTNAKVNDETQIS